MGHLQNSITAVEAAGNALNVKWEDGTSFAFHPMWLRERAPDAETLDPITGQRKIEAGFLPLQIGLHSAERSGASAIRLEFSDGTSGLFDGSELRAAIETAAAYDLVGAKTLWDGALAGFPAHKLADVSTRPDALLDLLNDLARFGCVLVEDVPAEKNGLLEFAGLIGNIKLTNWGGVEDIKVSPNAFDLSLTGRGLEPHVDNPYRFSTIGYVLLHCLQNSCEGGESTVVDGFAVAERLRRDHPESFRVLTSMPVYFRYEDKSAILENYRPLISVDGSDQILSVAYSNRTEFARPGSVSEMTAYYEARRLFAELLYSDEMTVEFKLRPGQLAIFDNYRVLHGRRAFDASNGERHMRQAYMDRDMVSSRQKVLMRDLQTVS